MIIVIGAGAVGCSIAYHLATRGATRGDNVLLIDKDEPGRGTSATNFGLIWSQSAQPYSYMDFNILSAQLWPDLVDELANELGADVDYQASGGLSLCMTDEEYAMRRAQLKEQQQSPLCKSEMLTPEEVFKIQPGASPAIKGAYFSPHDGSVNWVKWTRALFDGCLRAGVHFRPHTAVTRIATDNDGTVIGVETTEGFLPAEQVVVAAGVWAKELLAGVNVEVDLRPVRGQVLISEPVDMICPIAMSTVRQDPTGRFFMGVTREEVGFDRSITPEGYHAIRSHAKKLVPATEHLQIMTHFAGLRPIPGDGLPILGSVDRNPGLYIAVGHSGITLSPIHGRVISDLIIEGETGYPIDAYDPLRFERGKMAENKMTKEL